MDLARVIAIAMVTAFHLWRFFGNFKLQFGNIDIAQIAAKGMYGVDLFFVVSGFAMMLTWNSTGAKNLSFWKARFWRLYPAYAVAMVVWIVLVRSGVAPKSSGVLDVVAHSAFAHTLFPSTFYSISGVFWSLAIEVHFYLLFPLIVRMSRPIRLALAAYSVAYAFFVEGFLTDDAYKTVLTLNLPTFLCLFVLGMEIHSFRRDKWMKSLGWAGLVLAVSLMLLPDIASPHLMERLAIGGGLATFLLAVVPSKIGSKYVSAVVTLIGGASYSIYLYNYIFYVTKAPLITGALGFALYMTGIFAFGILMWFLVERNTEQYRKRRRQASSGVDASRACQTVR